MMCSYTKVQIILPIRWENMYTYDNHSLLLHQNRITNN